MKAGFSYSQNSPTICTIIICSGWNASAYVAGEVQNVGLSRNACILPGIEWLDALLLPDPKDFAFCGWSFPFGISAADVQSVGKTRKYHLLEGAFRMRIPQRNFFSQSLILLIFSGILFSPYTLSWSGSETGGNTPPGKELLRRQASYAQYAALIAGIRTPQSIMAPFESRPVWT